MLSLMYQWMKPFLAPKCQDVLFSLESVGNSHSGAPPVKSITENVPDETPQRNQVLQTQSEAGETLNSCEHFLFRNGAKNTRSSASKWEMGLQIKCLIWQKFTEH